MSKNENKDTNFGFKKVNKDKKPTMVKGVFDSVAENYDLMNDLMSFGIHRLWKRGTIELTNLREGDSVLDVAGGTGDLSILMSDLVGETGEIILSDINERMLKLGKARSLDKNKLNIKTAVADAENLPFCDEKFNCITIGFGIRNVTNKDKALKDFYRCLKPGGRLLVLEFSKPDLPVISDLYDFYSFKILPKLGKFFAQDEESYQYLAESIRMHPSQEEFKKMLESVNFKNVSYDIMSAGIVTLHLAHK
jgi:demethylmenaquinone methyltransferase/2-methoxy-6-polyprenyl-1,4-benzoquinol methylase